MLNKYLLFSWQGGGKKYGKWFTAKNVQTHHLPPPLFFKIKQIFISPGEENEYNSENSTTRKKKFFHTPSSTIPFPKYYRMLLECHQGLRRLLLYYNDPLHTTIFIKEYQRPTT